MKKSFALLFISVLLISACSKSDSSVAKVSGTEFLSQISKSDVLVIDVRTPEEYAIGHLPNSLNIDVQSDDFENQVLKLDKNATYGIYCRSGNRSTVASEKMAQLGFTSLINSMAGLDELVADGAMAITK